MVKNNISCDCQSILSDLIETSGKYLIKRNKFIKLSTGTAALLALYNTIGSNASASNSQVVEKVPSKNNSIAQGDNEVNTIYFGGSIVTMVSDGDRVEALAVKAGKIVAVGNLKDIMSLKGPKTKMVDLKGQCLMPGFVDPHSHVVMQSAKFATVNLDPAPIGKVTSIADIQRFLQEYIETKKPEVGTWILGWGYDDTAPEGMRHPTREDLDAVSTEHPIFLVHISNHLFACNSKLLEIVGINADTPDPEGGRIQRKKNSNEPNGVLEELAVLPVIKKLPTPTPEKAMEILETGLNYYAAAGITTAQDGATGVGAVALLEAMDLAGKLPIDVVSYPIYKGVDEATFDKIAANLAEFNSRKSNGVTNRFRLGGVKLGADGSIQGYTAFLSQPYYIQPGETEPTPDKCSDQNTEHMFLTNETDLNSPNNLNLKESNYRGYPNMTQEEITEWIRRCDSKNIPILVHTNGDGAIDMLIEAVKTVRQDQERSDLRTVIIHAQTIREDQLDFSAKQGLVPSFFPIHITYWGDRHRDIFLGPERAARISPAKSALNRGMKFTLHHDAPIAGIDMLPVTAASVNRLTSSGQELGLEERITPFEALRAITADAAWQYFEEDRKGTLEVGKLADLVILSNDPLAEDPLKIGDIQVIETIKEGKTIYTAET